MLAACTGDTDLVGFTRVLEGVGLGRGVLWVGAGEGRAVGSVQRRRRRREGGPALSSSSPAFLMARVGAEGTGSVAESPRGMATGFGRGRTVIFTVVLISPDFQLPGVRRKARKNFKFEFLKFSTLGDHYLSQGIQWYFCSEERMGFARIYI
jgi:hypothetical protein